MSRLPTIHVVSASVRQIEICVFFFTGCKNEDEQEFSIFTHKSY